MAQDGVAQESDPKALFYSLDGNQRRFENTGCLNRLYCWDIVEERKCALCNGGREMDHRLFSSCRRIRPIWSELLLRVGYCRSVCNVWTDELKWVISQVNGNRIKHDALRLLLSAFVYYVWQARNSAIFTGKLSHKAQYNSWSGMMYELNWQ